MSTAQQVETAAAKERFLANYVTTGNIAGCCRLTQIGRRTVYDWIEHDPAFKKLFEEAEIDATDALEQEARRRAIAGVEEPIYHAGKQVGSMRKYSDTLLIFLLKGKRPHVFRERFEHSGPGGGPIPLRSMPDTDLDARIATLEGLVGKP